MADASSQLRTCEVVSPLECPVVSMSPNATIQQFAGCDKETWIIDDKAYFRKGSQSTLRLERKAKTGEKRVVKMIPIKVARDNDKLFHREIKSMTTCKSNDAYKDLFVKIQCWFRYGDSFYIAMEYCPYGDLRMCCMTALPESYAKSIVKQVAKGLVFLHSSDILHRDVKPDNILVAKGPPIDTTIAVKIADFGVAKKVNSEQVEGTRANSHAGTNGFMAPEVHMGAGDDYTFSCDIWSLGCVQFWLLTLAEKIPQNLKFKQILEEKGVSTEAVNFCLSLTEYHPGRRPTASEVLEDAWLRGFTEVPITDRAQKAFMVGQGRKRSIMSQVECEEPDDMEGDDTAYFRNGRPAYSNRVPESHQSRLRQRPGKKVWGQEEEPDKSRFIRNQARKETIHEDYSHQRGNTLPASPGVPVLEEDVDHKRFLGMQPRKETFYEPAVRVGRTLSHDEPVLLDPEDFDSDDDTFHERRTYEDTIYEPAVRRQYTEPLHSEAMPGSFPVAPDPADREGRTDLWLAASRGDVVQVKRLLDEGAQVKQSDRKGLTPLHIAAHSGFYQVVEAILRHPKQNVAEFINLQTEDHAKETALSLAVKRGIHWTVKLILDYGGKALDPNLPNGWSRTPLMEALYLRHEPIPDLRHILGTLMEKDGVIGYITADGKSALWLAVESRDHLLFFDLLHRLALPKGSGSGVADRRLIDSIKHPIFALLCKLREPEPADDPSFSFMLLKGYWQDLSSPVFTRGSFYELLCCELFRMAAEEGSFKLLPVLHHHCGGHLISTNVLIEGMMTGAKNGHTSIVEQLVHENFANRRSVNDRDSDGKSVLIAAAGSGQFKVVEWLLNKYPTEKKLFTVPVDINAVDENGRTALIVAVEGHHIDIVSLLLKEGAKLHLMTKHDLSALHIAARSGVSEFAPALDAYLQRTQDRYSVELKDPHGHSALFIAAETPGGASLIKVLLKNGASPNDPDKNTGLTPLARAVERAILDNIDALLADPNRRINQPDHKDRTPLLIAAENLLNSGKEKHAQVVLKLLKSASTRRTPKDDFRALQPEAFDILRKFSQQKSGNELLKSAIWDKIAAFMHIYKEETDQRTAQTKSYDYYENVPKPANGRSKTTGDVPIYSNYQKPPSPIINQGAPHHSPYPASEDPYGIPEYAEVRPADSRPNHRLREQRAYKEARYHHVNSYQAIPGVRTYGAANQQRIRPTGYQYAVPGRPQASRHVTEPSNSAYIRTGGHNTRRERDYREVHQSDPRTYVASGYVAQPASNDPYRAPPGYPETHPLQPPPNPVNLQHPQALRVDPSAVPRAGPSFLSPDSAYATPGPYFEQAINQRRPRSATGPGLAPMWSPGDSQYSLDPPRVSEGGGVRRHHSTGRRQAPPGRSSEDFGRKGYAPRQTPSPQPLQGGYGYRQGQLPYIAPPGDSRLPPSAPRLDDSVNPSYY